MAELSSLHVKITGDSSSAILASAKLVNAMAGMKNEVAALQSRIKALGPAFDIATRRPLPQLNALNKQIRTSRFHTANLAAQFNDIGVMMASGQNWMIMAVQQGTQVSQVLQSIGGTGKEQLSALAASFRAVISPTALLTIGVIAGAAAFYQWATAADEAEEKTNSLKETLKELAKESKEAGRELEALRRGLKDIDELNRQEALEMQLALLVKEQQKLEEIIESEKKLGNANQSRIRSQQRAAAILQREIDLLVEQIETIKELAKAKKIAADKAEADAKILEIRQEEINEIAGEHARIQQMVADNIKKAAQEAWDLEQALAAAAAAGARIHVTGFSNDMSMVPGEGANIAVADQRAEELRKQWADYNKPDRKGGGGATKDPFQADFEKLQEHLKSEVQLELDINAERERILNEALQRKQITQQEHYSMMEELNRQHQEKMAELDVWRYGSSLQKTDAFLGDMAEALSHGGEEMLRISKAFGAAQALVSAWIGAAKALELPFPQNLAAFAKVLATGLGAVQAIKGVGKGGSGGTGGAVGGGASGPTNPTYLSFSFTDQMANPEAVGRFIVEKMNEAIRNGATIQGLRVS